MEKEDTLMRTKKIKLKLTSIQKKVLRKWSYHHRFTYNKTINYITQEYNEYDYYDLDHLNTNLKKNDLRFSMKQNPSIYYSKLELRNFIVPESGCSRTPWLLETPKAIRESAVFEADKNLRSAISNLTNGNISFFDLRYKTKKHMKWTIGIPKQSINNYTRSVGIYESRTTNFRIKTTENVPKIDHDCTIHFDGLNYYLNIQSEIDSKENIRNNWFASLDPGVRKFQTLYCPDEDEYIMIGNRASEKMYNKLFKLDFLCSKKSTRKNEKAKIKIRNKVQNLQTELHYKLSNFLCKKYRNIFIPKLTKENDIISKKNRKIRTTTERKMVVLGHSKFIERLKTKALEFKNVNVKIITEEYTSQTCLSCRNLTKTSNEMFKCNHCGYILDRDMLGSTNILLKNW